MTELIEIRVPPENFDPATQKIVGIDRVVDEEAGTVTLRPIVVDLDAEELAALATENAALLAAAKADRKAAATERRKVERDRGVVINGNRWQSDKESFDNVASHVNTGRLYEAGQGAGTFQTRWKTVDGFISVTLTDLIKAQLTIGLFVQACFAREDALFSAIDEAETAEDILAISLDSGWPDDGGPKDASTIQAIQQANARLERRAKELEARGDFNGAQLLRLQMTEI